MANLKKCITQAEHVARLIVCRANDVDPYVPDASIERLFASYDGERATDEVRKALARERWIWGGLSLVVGVLLGWSWWQL